MRQTTQTDNRECILMSGAKDAFHLVYNVQMSAEESDTAEVTLYGEIVDNMPSYWKYFYPEDKSGAEFKKEIDRVRKDGATKLKLRINSPGGVCTEAVTMRSVLADAGFDEVTILIEGLCASAATTVATIPGAHVVIAEGSEYMIHNPWCYTYGNANDLEHTVERLRNIEQMTRGFYVAKTSQPEDKIKEWMDHETWFTAEQAVQYGFADEVRKANLSNDSPAMACVSKRDMDVMKALYKTVPEQITVTETGKKPEQKESEKSTPANHVSTGDPVAGSSAKIPHNIKEDDEMALENITLEQLRTENPQLFQSIQQSAVDSERARLDDIDALTIPGYEELAAKAKADGTSALDFQKQLVTAMKEKKGEFIQNRVKETALAQKIPGSVPTSGTADEEKEIQDNAKDIAAYAKEYGGDYSANGMF